MMGYSVGVRDGIPWGHMLAAQGWTTSVTLLTAIHSAACQTVEANPKKEAAPAPLDWKTIFAYVCFVVGGLLLLFGFARLIWWALTYRRRKHKKKSERWRQNFSTSYYNDPWLRENQLTHQQQADADSLTADLDVIYALPIDTRPDTTIAHARVLPDIRATEPVPDYSNGHAETELSQTESQIYEGSSGRGSGGNSNTQNSAGVSPVYSVPHKGNGAVVQQQTYAEISASALRDRMIQEGDVRDGGGNGYKPPGGAGNTHTAPYSHNKDRSLPEADMPSARRPYATLDRPAGAVPAVGPPGGPPAPRDPRDPVTLRPHSLTGSQGGAALGRDARTSDSSMYSFRDRYGTEVPASPNRRSVGAGSTKSYRSLYRYMNTSEPVALDGEIEYDFVSSFH